MVAPPCVEYLLRNERNIITVGKCYYRIIESSYQLMRMVPSLSDTINSTDALCWAAPHHSHRS